MSNFKEYLQEPIFNYLRETAKKTGLECYVIGGFVRDILLKRPSKDINVVAFFVFSVKHVVSPCSSVIWG